MAKTSKHYLANGKLYTGPIHKTNNQVMTGIKHTASSKILTHTKTKTKK